MRRERPLCRERAHLVYDCAGASCFVVAFDPAASRSGVEPAPLLDAWTRRDCRRTAVTGAAAVRRGAEVAIAAPTRRRSTPRIPTARPQLWTARAVCEPDPRLPRTDATTPPRSALSRRRASLSMAAHRSRSPAGNLFLCTATLVAEGRSPDSQGGERYDLSTTLDPRR